MQGSDPTQVGVSTDDDRRLREFLKDRASAPWGDVVKLFWRVIASTIIKVLRRYGQADPSEVDDLVQDVYLRLCGDNYRLFRESRAERPAQLFALVQAVATTTTLDRYRSSTTLTHGGGVHVIPIDQSVSAEHDHSQGEQTFTREILI